MSRYRLIAFDLDGTLVDSRRDLAESANQLLEEHGGSPHSEEEIGRMVGDGAATLVARVFATAGRPQPPEALARFLTIYNGRLLRFTRPYPGVPELLSQLEGRATLAVLTNKPLKATQMILGGLELAKPFGELVIGGDGPFPRKPDPAGLRHLMTTTHAGPPETLLVGDSPNDWRTALAAQASGCVVRYGFGYDGFPTADSECRVFGIDHPLDLLEEL